MGLLLSLFSFELTFRECGLIWLTFIGVPQIEGEREELFELVETVYAGIYTVGP